MTIQTYTGSCHCQTVRFELDADLTRGSGRCNCSICTKIRHWGVVVQPASFRLLSGADQLGDYQFASHTTHFRFCTRCGVHLYCNGHVAELGGDFVSVAANCLDGVDPSALLSGPITYYDGRNDNWGNVPAETRHL
jgi:hypothetical protein